MKVTLYKKSGCPWAATVAGFLNELDVPFKVKNVITHPHHPHYAKEVEKKFARCISPT
jgi:glutaredoxin